jgi:four helix bundle suffix protein
VYDKNMGNWGDQGNKGNEKIKAGYEYLLCYKLSVPIYDYTVEYCRRWIDPRSRTTDQMVQAARSGMQNILEGNKQQGLKGYIKLTGIARGSLTELLEDYHTFARQHDLSIWSKEKAVGEIREIGEIWEIIKRNPSLPDDPNFPYLPNSSLVAVNLMITLTHQANYLLDRLIVSLKERHRTHGGLTEELYQARKSFRGY